MFNVLTWYPCLEEKGNYVSVNHHYGLEAQSSVWVFSSDVTRDQGLETAGDVRPPRSEAGLREVTIHGQREDEVKINLSHTFDAYRQ